MQAITETMEDHALESVLQAKRENWLQITWNTAGLVTTLVMLFFGALVCFVAGVKIALLAGSVTFVVGSSIAWALAKVTYVTGYSNTLITRQYGLGIKGSALASMIFGFLIIGFLALENALLYRGFLFFFSIEDGWISKLFIYGGLSITWILLTAFGFKLVTRFSSIMLIAFFCTLIWILVEIFRQSGMGGLLMYAGSAAMVEYYSSVQGLTLAAAHQQVLQSPDSIAATFMVFAGLLGFVAMIFAQVKTQVLNTYSASLCITNLFDALFSWRPGRVTFVVLANIIGLILLYGHILELVEQWIKLLGVFLDRFVCKGNKYSVNLVLMDKQSPQAISC